MVAVAIYIIANIDLSQYLQDQTMSQKYNFDHAGDLLGNAIINAKKVGNTLKADESHRRRVPLSTSPAPYQFIQLAPVLSTCVGKYIHSNTMNERMRSTER